MTNGHETVRLGDLEQNDYNPRTAPLRHGSDVDIDTESLAESIDAVGLDNALTVRPLDDGGYEVVTGERRYLALETKYDDDYQVPVDVRELSEDEARRLCRAENEEREDLSVMQQTWGWAESVTVEADGEEMSYAEYVEFLSTDVSTESLHVPSRDGVGVEALAGENQSKTKIHEWLSFLLLPRRARQWINSDDLPKRAARMIVRRVRNGKRGEYDAVDDPQVALGLMAELADTYGDPDGKYSNGIRGDQYDELQADIQSRVEEYHRRKEIAEEDTEQYADLLTERAVALRESITAVVEDDAISLNSDEIPAIDETDAVADIPADELASVGEQLRNSLGESADGLLDDAHDLETTARDIEKKRTNVKKALAAHDGECVYCRQEVEEQHLRDVIESYEDDAQAARDDSAELKDRASELREWKSTLNHDITNVEKAQESYNDAMETAQEFADGVVGDD